MEGIEVYRKKLREGQITRREFMKAALVLGFSSSAAASLLASCAPAPTPAPTPEVAETPAVATPTPAPKPARIQVMFESGVPKTMAVLEHLEGFTASTGIDITPVEVPTEQMHEKLMTDFQSGAPQFDAGMIFAEAFLPQFAAAGLLEPAEDYFSDEDINDLTDVARKLSMYDGVLYAWPWYEHTCGILYYRTDLLEEAGIVDQQGNPKPPTTWEEYVDAAVKLTGNGVYGTLVEGKRDQEALWRFLSRIWQAGGDVLDEAGNVTIAEGPAAKAVQFQLDLLYEHEVSPPGSLSYYCVDAHTMFMQGQLAMVENWPYMFALANDPSQSQVAGKFWIAPSIGDVKRTWSANQFTWVVPKASKHKAEVFEFLRWLTSKEMLIQAALTEAVPPDRKSLQDAPEFAEHAEFPIVAQAISMGRPIPLTPKWPEIRDIVIDEWQFGLLEEKTPEQAMSDAAERIEAVLG